MTPAAAEARGGGGGGGKDRSQEVRNSTMFVSKKERIHVSEEYY